MFYSTRFRSISTAVFAGALIAACGGSLLAQGVRRYQPATPTVSPYADLSRFNSGGLPNYHALVRPQQQQRQFNLRERSIRRDQGRQLGQLNRNLLSQTGPNFLSQPGRDLRSSQTPVAATGTGSWFMNAGARARYLDTDRFYPIVQSPRPRR